MRVQSVVLEHHGHVTVLRRELVDDLRTDRDGAGRDLFETGDHPKGGGLAAARRTDQDHELTIDDLQIEIRDRLGTVVEDLGDAIECDLGHG